VYFITEEKQIDKRKVSFRVYPLSLFNKIDLNCYVFPPLSNDKLLLIIILFFVHFFPSFISNTSIVSINFRANLDAQNAGNGISGFQISNIFWVVWPHTRGFLLRPPLISNDKLGLIFF
jgi:hypothetical protein